MISQISRKCVYAKFSWWCARHHLAWIDPPRDTMPVIRPAVSGTYRSSTPACTVK